MAKFLLYEVSRSGHVTPLACLSDDAPKAGRRVLRPWVQVVLLALVAVVVGLWLYDSVARAFDTWRLK